jgi:outer membrane protein assembly factor BamA
VCVNSFARVVSFAAVAALLTSAMRAGATPPEKLPEVPIEVRTPENLDPRRYELAGFPVVGGSSDIGVQFGAAVTWTRFFDQARPYLWNVDLLLSGSVKDDQNGVRLVQQSHVLRLDAPDLLDDKLRVDARGSFQRTINAGYYGLGNASLAGPQIGETKIGQRYQYTQQEGRVRTIDRWHVAPPWDIAVGTNLRYEAPDVYDPSKLHEDLAARWPDGAAKVPGGESAFLIGLAAGLMYDTRDSEFVTRMGAFYQLGGAFTVGTAEHVAYGELAAVLAHYAPIAGPFTFANRVVASFQFGRPPFYDLQQGGVFEPQGLFGGETGVRGVPQGRYAGRIKMLTNTEIRATPFPRFSVLKQRFMVGMTTFFDVGRLWNDYAAVSPVDGRDLGLKYGAGGGLFLQWGEAAIFRIDIAYSPDAVSENPGFPVGIYVSDGAMF